MGMRSLVSTPGESSSVSSLMPETVPFEKSERKMRQSSPLAPPDSKYSAVPSARRNGMLTRSIPETMIGLDACVKSPLALLPEVQPERATA